MKNFDGTAGLSDISVRVKREIDEFLPIMPLVTSLRNPGMRERHWEALTAELGIDMMQAASTQEQCIDCNSNIP